GTFVAPHQIAQLEAIEADVSIEFAFDHLDGGRTDAEMHRPPGLQQHLEQSHPVGSAARTSDGQDEVGGGHAMTSPANEANARVVGRFFKPSVREARTDWKSVLQPGGIDFLSFYWIGQGADTGDLCIDDVVGFEEDRRLASLADAAGRAGRDDVARF